jgi:hypothetical protein
MGLPCVGVSWMWVWWELNRSRHQTVWCIVLWCQPRWRVCFLISISCRWKICMKSDSQEFIFIPLLHVCSNSMDWSAFPYSCRLFKICNAYAEIELFVLMYLVCSRCFIPIDLLVWPTYELIQVLRFSLYMPLEFILFCSTLLQSWLYRVLVVRKAMF